MVHIELLASWKVQIAAAVKWNLKSLFHYMTQALLYSIYFALHHVKVPGTYSV